MSFYRDLALIPAKGARLSATALGYIEVDGTVMSSMENATDGGTGNAQTLKKPRIATGPSANRPDVLPFRSSLWRWRHTVPARTTVRSASRGNQ